MWQPTKNIKIGYECDFCGNHFGDIGLSNICQRCQKRICPQCSTIHFTSHKLSSPLFRYRRIEKPSHICPDCKEILESEEAAAQAEKDEESSRPITKCSLCASTDEPPEYKIFGYRLPTFTNCDRCGKLVCDQCSLSPPDSSFKYNLVCSECYSAIEQEDARIREEYWREEEENKLED